MAGGDANVPGDLNSIRDACKVSTQRDPQRIGFRSVADLMKSRAKNHSEHSMDVCVAYFFSAGQSVKLTPSLTISPSGVSTRLEQSSRKSCPVEKVSAARSVSR